MSSLRSRLINSRLAPNSSTHSSTLHSSLRLQRRSYAVLVNRSTSVDSSFGNTPPPAPNQDSNSSPSLRTRTPIGAQVSGSPFPNRDPINQNTPPSSWGRGLGGKAPNPPSSPIKAANLNQQSNQGSTSDRDREHPHPASIPDQNGNFNSLDSKILKAARALLLQEQKDSPSSSSTIRTDTSDTTSSPSDLKQLLSSFSSLANHQLPFSLPYEPTPDQARKVPLTTARSTPSEIELAKDDGVVLVAYVDGLEIEGSETGGSKGPEPKISVCSGFAVEGKKWLADKGVGKGELLITCAHTLQSCLPRSSSSSSTTSTSSLGLVMTRTGQVYRIHSLLSSLPTSDLILLQLSEKPISVDSEEEALPAKSGLRTLPLSPYPSPVGTELCVSSFSGWENDSIANAFGQAAAAFSKSSTSSNNSSSDTSVHGLKPNPNFDSNPIKASSEAEERARARGRWGRARLVEYKDPSGREARTGTYDELSQLEFKVLTDSNDNLPPFMTSTSSSQQSPSSSSSSSQDQVETTNTSNNLPFFSTLSNFPPPGSSGGPVVESSTGAVVGVVRGSKMSALEGRRGDAIPAEKIFEFFALPGIGNKKL